MFTYELSTDRGKCRLLMADNNGASYTFEDSEIDAFLDLAPASVYAAAALACRTMGRSQLTASAVTRQSDGSSVQRRPLSDWLALAQDLEDAALRGDGLVADTWATSTPGELLDQFRPEWRSVNDLPVVE